MFGHRRSASALPAPPSCPPLQQQDSCCLLESTRPSPSNPPQASSSSNVGPVLQPSNSGGTRSLLGVGGGLVSCYGLYTGVPSLLVPSQAPMVHAWACVCFCVCLCMCARCTLPASLLVPPQAPTVHAWACVCMVCVCFCV